MAPCFTPPGYEQSKIDDDSEGAEYFTSLQAVQQFMFDWKCDNNRKGHKDEDSPPAVGAPAIAMATFGRAPAMTKPTAAMATAMTATKWNRQLSRKPANSNFFCRVDEVLSRDENADDELLFLAPLVLRSDHQSLFQMKGLILIPSSRSLL